MVEQFDYPISPTIQGILERAEPEETRPDLKLLLINILLYIKRVEKEFITEVEKRFPGHRKFKFLNIPLSSTLKESLQSRLSTIEKYRIRSSTHIREILLHGLTRTTQKTLSSNQVAVLKLLSDEPQLRATHLSKRLGLSRPTISKILHQLRNEFGLVSGHLIDYSKFKLTTFSMMFQTRSYEDSIKLENWAISTSPPFLKTLVFDIYYRKGYIVFAIPTQQRALQSFELRVDWLNRKFMDQTHLHQIQGLFWNLRFDHYDLNQGIWIEPTGLTQQTQTTISTTQEPKDAHFQQTIQFGDAIKFTQMDYLLAHAEQKGAYTLNEKRDLLDRFNFSCSEKTVWAHLQQLRNQRVLVPYIYISNAGFEEFICISALCDENAYAPIKFLASRLPFTYTYLTNCGITIFLKKPIGWSNIINRLTHRIAQFPGVHDFIVVHQERNVGSTAEPELYRRWNEKRQFWEFDNKDI